MKFSEAKEIIDRHEKPEMYGFRVHFERRHDGVLSSDSFPEHEEPPIKTEEEAWEWARRLAACGPLEWVNIRVRYAAPGAGRVPGAREKELNKYPEA